MEKAGSSAQQAGTADSRALYLDLMKKTLSFMLWPEPPQPYETISLKRPWATRLFLGTVARVLKSFKLRMMVERKFTGKQREDGLVWPGYADTMIGMKRLDNLQYCVETVIKEKVSGDLIETGVWRGGSCIFMKAVLKSYGVTDRKIFVADSFEGLPAPDEEKYPADTGDKHHTLDFFVVSQEEVENNFKKYNLWDDQIVFLKGWFKDTLPSAPIQKLSILRLDGDMYGSTIEVLEALYPKLSPGGFCLIDDYALPGCKKAVDDYRTAHGITTALEPVDWTGRYWRKE
jgi:hypothetical protein